jgi:hypothetical protein
MELPLSATGSFLNAEAGGKARVADSAIGGMPPSTDGPCIFLTNRDQLGRRLDQVLGVQRIIAFPSNGGA